jgi:hypothetical protein
VSDTGLLAYIRSVLNKKQFAAAELVFGQHSLIIRKKLFEAAGEVIGLQDAVDSEVDEKQWHLAYLAERLGFSLVFLEMVRSKKPVVGHFCIFDWMYVYSSCYAPMPKKVDDFFKGLRRLFPSTFDTKVLCQYAKAFDKKLQSGLGKLYSYMRDNAPKQLRLIEIEEFSEELKHDAGYDSSITGFSFVYLCMIILNKCSLDKLKEDCKKSLDFHSWPDGSEMYLNAERVVEYYSDEAIKTGGADPKDISKLIVCRWTPHSGTKEEEIKMIDELAEVVSDSYSFQLHRINKSNFYLEIKSSEQLDLPPLIAQLNEKFQTRIRFSDYDHPLIEDIDRFWISRMGHV